jgi:hypothetical protein
MQKEEFPTFLNEQPAVIFGRTARELLIIIIGLSTGYLLSQYVGNAIAVSATAGIALKVAIAAIPLILSVIMAFAKVATRPLEEWGLVWLFYSLIPKVYLHIPFEEDVTDKKAKDTRTKYSEIESQIDEDEEYEI